MTVGLKRALTVLSILEMVSIAGLLLNLATIHDATAARVLGPVHGMLYLAVVAIAVLGRGLTRRARIGAVIPVLSGPLTLVNMRSVANPPTAESGTSTC